MKATRNKAPRAITTHTDSATPPPQDAPRGADGAACDDPHRRRPEHGGQQGSTGQRDRHDR